MLARAAIALALVITPGCSRQSADRAPAPAPATEPAPKTPAPKPERPLAGSYTATRTAITPCDDTEGCEVQVEDRMTITESADKNLAVAVELARGDAGSCALSRTLAPAAADRWEWRASEGDDCTIALVLGSDLQLSVQGCRRDCGALTRVESTFAYPPAAAAAPPVDCDELCTDIATCWEEVHGGSYRGGSDCSDACEGRSEAAKRDVARCVQESANCQKTLECL